MEFLEYGIIFLQACARLGILQIGHFLPIWQNNIFKLQLESQCLSLIMKNNIIKSRGNQILGEGNALWFDHPVLGVELKK